MSLLPIFAFVVAAIGITCAQDPASASARAPKQDASIVVCHKARPTLEQQHQTKVVLMMVLTEDGKVASFHTLSPKGLYLEEDKAVLKAVKSMVFTPASKDGHPVAVQILFPVDCSSAQAPPDANDNKAP